MSRIFTVLAITSLILIAINLTLGLTITDYPQVAKKIRTSHQTVGELQRAGRNEQHEAMKQAREAVERVTEESRPIRRRVLVHMLLGIGAGIVAILVNSISVTYFVGTSRWCKEVVETYQMNPDYVTQSNILKRRSFPWAVAGMLTVVVMVALGGAADPSNSLSDPEKWANVHLAGAFVGMAMLAFSFWIQFSNIIANHALINTVLAEVKTIRAARGLDTASE